MNDFTDKVNSQIENFYFQRQNISHCGQVDCIITSDIFSKRMELVQSIRDKEITLQQKEFLQKVNGNIVWGKTNNNKITVLIASKVFSLDDYTWRGTVHHEFTHAHDFWDLADHLNTTEMDSIYDYQFYAPFDWWTEFHARKSGAINVYRHEYAHNSISQTINVCNTMFDYICKTLMSVSQVYDAMQLFGRYSALKEMYGNIMPDIQTASNKYGLSKSIISVGEFLLSHQEFALIQNKFDEFQYLIYNV